MRKLTDEQRRELGRVFRASGQTEPLSRRVGNQLVKKGLLRDTGRVYERHEWGRVVARLPIYAITPLGRERASEETR